MRKELSNKVAIVGSFGMGAAAELLAEHLAQKSNVIIADEAITYVNHNHPRFQTIDNEKKRTKPCKRHEYIGGICRHCNQPLK